MLSELKLPLGQLTEEEKLIFNSSLNLGSKIPSSQIDQTAEIPDRVFKELKTAGYFGLGYPEEFGGCYSSESALGLAIMAISFYCASTGIVLSVHNSLVGSLLTKHCSDSQKSDWFPKLSSGSWIGCFSLSEPEAGSDAKNIKSTYKVVDNGFLLNGQKAWVTNGPYAEFCVCFLKDENGSGISAFGVNLKSAGILVHKPEDKLGIRGAKTSSLTFENVLIPPNSQIGGSGDGLKVALHGLNHGRLGVACQSLGIGWRAFYEAFQYASQRSAFGQKIINYQLIQNYLSEMRTRLDHATAFTFYCLRNENRHPRECAEAKLFASETSCFCVDKALQIFGGNGYVRDFIVERLYRDARVTTIYEGSSEIQKINIIKFLSKELT
ncbi:MAG: acyl-CoA dehydrogenase family protein [Deltaproteobacteria bacterium]|nr:acyl-CoA dehydrogenase family protein [Deltaproteobacteria bacterium]